MNSFVVTASPHLRSGNSTAKIMLDVIIALCPALIAGTIFFGWRSLVVVATCVMSCVLFEYAARRIMRRSNTIGDCSAVVTGMLLAFNLPVTIPLWMAVVGSFIAIVIVKQLFGGIGQNFANPAITARIVLMISFTSQMTHWVPPFFYRTPEVDAVTTATPLALLSAGETLPPISELFLGLQGGCIGEVSALALLLGGGYLLLRRVISPTTPLVFLGTVFLFSDLLGVQPIYQLLSGGLMLGAFFMATDYSTSPLTEWGKAIFGFGCGLITVVIRLFGSYPEGVSFSILLMNILVPYIDRATARKPLGGKKRLKSASREE